MMYLGVVHLIFAIDGNAQRDRIRKGEGEKGGGDFEVGANECGQRRCQCCMQTTTMADWGFDENFCEGRKLSFNYWESQQKYNAMIHRHSTVMACSFTWGVCSLMLLYANDRLSRFPSNFRNALG